MKNFKLLIMAVAILIFAGCSPRIQVSINSIGSTPHEYQSYILLSGMKDTNPNDLQYKEYAGYINNALQDKGFKQVDFANADIVVFLYYGISDPVNEQYSYSKPIYGQTGVSSSYSSGTLNSYGNMATYSGTTTYTPTYGVVGSQNYSGTKTNYIRHIVLDAVDAKKYKDTQEIQSLWKTTIMSTGSSSDLRTVFPILLGAGKEYIGTNTGKAIMVQCIPSMMTECYRLRVIGKEDGDTPLLPKI